MTQNPDQPISYVIRMSRRARREVDEAVLWLGETTTADNAIEWLTEFDITVASLAQFPRRCPRVAENFRGEVRQLIYRRQGSQMAHRILFVIINEEIDAQDPPTVKPAVP